MVLVFGAKNSFAKTQQGKKQMFTETTWDQLYRSCSGPKTMRHVFFHFAGTGRLLKNSEWTKGNSILAFI